MVEWVKGKNDWRGVFSRLRKTVSDGADETCCGRLFQTRAAATGKDRSPMVESRVRDITVTWLFHVYMTDAQRGVLHPVGEWPHKVELTSRHCSRFLNWLSLLLASNWKLNCSAELTNTHHRTSWIVMAWPSDCARTTRTYYYYYYYYCRPNSNLPLRTYPARLLCWWD